MSVYRFRSAAGSAVFYIVLFTSIGTSRADCVQEIQFVPGGACNGTCLRCANSLECISNICMAIKGSNCGSPPSCINGTTCSDITDSLTCRLDAGQNCSEPSDDSLHTGYCGDGLLCDDVKNKCVVPFGGSCAGDLSDDCTTNTECEDDQCRIVLGQDCSGGNENFCMSSTACDTASVCKYEAGQACNDTDQCAADTTCESDVCKSEVGNSCNNVLADPCVSGAACDQNVCRLEAGQGCEGDKANKCLTALVCEDDLCKLDVDGNCMQNSSLCKEGLVCHDNFCKVEVGGNCVDDATACGPGTVCDLYICKLEAGRNCSGSNWAYCSCGTLCEDDFCRLNTGESCAGNSGNCRSGNTCEDDVCKLEYGEDCQDKEGHCTKTTACDNESGYVCKKKVGTGCSSSSECVNNTECSSSCQCRDDYIVDHATGLCLRSSSAPLSGSALLLLLLVLLLRLC